MSGWENHDPFWISPKEEGPWGPKHEPTSVLLPQSCHRTCVTSSAAPVPAMGSGPSPSLLLRFLFRAAAGATGASQGPGCRGHFGVLHPDGAVTVTTNAQQTPALRNRNLTCSTRPWDGSRGAMRPSGLGAPLLALTQLSRCASPWGHRYSIPWGSRCASPQGSRCAAPGPAVSTVLDM